MKRSIQNAIWDLVDVYRGLMYSDRLLGAIIRIMFVKYVTDNYSFAETRDEMRYYANIQKAISNRDINAFTNSIIPVLEMIDSKVHANGVIIRSYSAISDDLLSVANKKKNYSIDQSKMVLDVISSIDLDTTNIDKELLLSALQEFIYSAAANAGKYGGELTTTVSVNRLASKLLKVDSSDSYMDFACGYGLSAMEIMHGDTRETYLSDISEEAVQIAFMLNVIAGTDFEKVHISISDVFENEFTNILASKMFVDFPFNLRMDRNLYEYREGTILAIHKMIDHLEENGIGAITCHSAILFTRSKEGSDLRNYLLSNGYLYAVITLPPVMMGTTINVNLLVFSMQNNQEVLFIDASNNDFVQFSKNARVLNAQLTHEGIDRIADIFDKKEEIPGVSIVVKKQKILEMQTLTPAAYIEKPTSKDYMSVEEISKELHTLYERLSQLNS